ncbi:MAG: N-acetylglucosamine kinase [Anaerolineales bacterium]
MKRWMGIDGGGSSLRVVIVDDDMHQLAYAESGAANPSSIGHSAAAAHIQETVQRARAGIGDIAGVGVGIAGASYEYAEDWLRQTLTPVLPKTPITPSSDVEIALVGGRAALDGVLLLAGTGSTALVITPQGDYQRIGGWGYLLGDEGSGYWIGTQALNRLTQWGDGLLTTDSTLPQALMHHLGLPRPLDLIAWRYGDANQQKVAALARLVLDHAQDGDPLAINILQNGASHLSALVKRLLERYQMSPEAVVFAGSLLTHDTLLRQYVIQQLNLTHDPQPRYPPVIGAALLAKLKDST